MIVILYLCNAKYVLCSENAFCAHLAVCQAKNCGGGCQTDAPAKGFAKRSIRPKTRLSMAAEGAVNAYKGAEGAIIRAFNHEGMKIVESSCNR